MLMYCRIGKLLKGNIVTEDGHEESSDLTHNKTHALIWLNDALV